jgi:hypothetical protein
MPGPGQMEHTAWQLGRPRVVPVPSGHRWAGGPFFPSWETAQCAAGGLQPRVPPELRSRFPKLGNIHANTAGSGLRTRQTPPGLHELVSTLSHGSHVAQELEAFPRLGNGARHFSWCGPACDVLHGQLAPALVALASACLSGRHFFDTEPSCLERSAPCLRTVSRPGKTPCAEAHAGHAEHGLASDAAQNFPAGSQVRSFFHRLFGRTLSCPPPFHGDCTGCAAAVGTRQASSRWGQGQGFRDGSVPEGASMRGPRSGACASPGPPSPQHRRATARVRATARPNPATSHL